MRAEMKFQSYPWYVQDWFVSDARARLTLEERGLYREILDLLYLHEGFLEDDPDILQRKTGCKEKEFLRSWPKVKACFDVSDDGRLCHPKVLETLSKVYKYKTERSESGKIGAETRWKGRAKGSANGSAIGQPLATGWQNDSLPQPQPLPQPLPQPQPQSAAIAPVDSLVSEIAKEMRAKHRKTTGLGGLELERELCGLTGDAVDPAAVLRSIRARWRLGVEREWAQSPTQYWPNLLDWLRKRRYLDPEPPERDVAGFERPTKSRLEAMIDAL